VLDGSGRAAGWARLLDGSGRARLLDGSGRARLLDGSGRVHHSGEKKSIIHPKKVLILTMV
jgi:hypothetical protein